MDHDFITFGLNPIQKAVSYLNLQNTLLSLAYSGKYVLNSSRIPWSSLQKIHGHPSDDTTEYPGHHAAKILTLIVD